ncbi:MAG: hypothetical protein JO297_13840 [Nitrososphaeraceae archaeon]|nr:hypothetical protein [Nitrososphaeraceae archaeon]
MENILMDIEHRICQGRTDKEIMEELGIKEGHSTTTNRRYTSYPQMYIKEKYIRSTCI